MTADANGTTPYDWRFDSGRICLDLIATSDPGSGPEPLLDSQLLGRWLLGVGLLPAGTSVSLVDGPWAVRFVDLRLWIDQVIRAELGGRYADSALERVNAVASGSPPPIRAVRKGSGPLVRALGAAPECGALLAAVARDAVDLLTDPDALARLRECEGESCRRVYLDTSRGRRRRWCSSEVCGNRERVARHRRRAAAIARA
ncbi:CGNR zinc finger domain-containing protein [Streptomyces albipurpureus]|uniref:ABATE domain-containing protein n=1 Tax=Streptomyces albipurpureus TaxID=2897419 RepID=A0ABT0UYT6_9ACTN|nr:ABATE domain-containing protein [Streptomyces sp. CWNU-1]MCM2392291.1 ABATE domain-containing protein [Streptomyces sp. CWNU-1]